MNKRLTVYHIISCILVTALGVGLGFAFWKIFFRTWQVLQEFGFSVAYYVDFIFNADWQIQPVLNQSNYIEGFSFDFLPANWNIFFLKLGAVFEQVFNKTFWRIFLSFIGPKIEIVCRVLLIMMPFFLLVYFMCKKYFGNHEEEIGVISRPLLVYQKFSDKALRVIEEIKDFLYFFWNTFYRLIFIVIVLYFTNIINIGIAALSWYFYFVCSFDFLSIWIQFKRLITDLSHLFKPVFIPAWITLGAYIFYKVCKKIAMDRLEKLHGHDVCFVNDLGIDNLVVGNVNKGKTTLITDMSITAEMVFNDIALDRLINISSLFPSYDFRRFEEIIDRAKQEHKIYNLSSIKKWFSEKINEDYKLIGLESGNSFINLYDSLKNYALLYFVYTARSSYIYGTISVRSAKFCVSEEHLRQFTHDFFEPSVESYEHSNFAHIFDYNNFRLEKKIDNRLEWSNSSDIGIYLFDEIGKERGNMLELEDVKKGSEETNQKNDGFNKYLKMARHSSTIDNYPFFKLFASEQRMDSVPADYRELNDYILQVADSTKNKNTIPFYFYLDWITGVIYNLFKKWFMNWRFNRDAQTLVFHFIKQGFFRISLFRKRIENKYGFKVAELKIYDGHENFIRDGEYYLLASKIYSNRFKTDAYGDFFYERGLKSEHGLDDVPSYESEFAKMEELKDTNSYFINSLIGAKKKILKKDSKYSNWKTQKELDHGKHFKN